MTPRIPVAIIGSAKIVGLVVGFVILLSLWNDLAIVDQAVSFYGMIVITLLYGFLGRLLGLGLGTLCLVTIPIPFIPHAQDLVSHGIWPRWEELPLLIPLSIGLLSLSSVGWTGADSAVRMFLEARKKSD